MSASSRTSPALKKLPQLHRKKPADGKVWGIAWIWGGSTLAYDTEKFKEAPTRSRALGPGLSGQVCWKDDAEDSVRFTALAFGSGSECTQDMVAIGAKLRELEPQIKALWKTEDE